MANTITTIEEISLKMQQQDLCYTQDAGLEKQKANSARIRYYLLHLLAGNTHTYH